MGIQLRCCDFDYVGRACLVKPDGTIVGASSASKRYAALRLETESLLAVETEAASVDAVAGRLRLQGGPAIFILREFAPVAPPNPVCEPLGGDWEGMDASWTHGKAWQARRGHDAKPGEG